MPPKSSIPDADLHPVATGAAHSIVEAHSKSAPHILYSGWFCPFVQRSWIVLEEKRIPYQYVEINPYNKEPSFLALNPRGLVPTLGCPVPENSGGKVLDGDAGAGAGDGIARKPLIESNVICEYLDGLPEHGRSLFSADLYERAREKVWIDFVGSRIIGAFHRVLQHTPEKPYSLEEAKVEVRGHLRTWIAEANMEEGPYWSGKEFGMVDVALAPWAVRLWVFEHFKGVRGLVPEKGQGGDDEKIWDRWREWFGAVAARESVRGTLSEREYYMPIYQRYADDKAQSELAKATRAGRGVP